jgi:hypothetical protein
MLQRKDDIQSIEHVGSEVDLHCISSITKEKSSRRNDLPWQVRMRCLIAARSGTEAL